MELFGDTPPRRQNTPPPLGPANALPPAELLGPFLPEILSLIFSYAPTPTLASCVAVNTVWANLALPALYKHLKLDPDHWPTFGRDRNYDRNRNQARRPRRWESCDELVHMVRTLEVDPHRGCRALPISKLPTSYPYQPTSFNRLDMFCLAMRQTALPFPVLPSVQTLRVRVNVTEYGEKGDMSKSHFCPAIRAGNRAPTLVVYTSIIDATPRFSAGMREHIAVVLRTPKQWPTRKEVIESAARVVPGVGMSRPSSAEEVYNIEAAKFAAWLPPVGRVTIVFLDTGGEWTQQAWERAGPMLRETSRVLGARGELTVIGAEQLLQVHDPRAEIEMVLWTSPCLKTFRFQDWLDTDACTDVLDVPDLRAARRWLAWRQRRLAHNLPLSRSSPLPPTLMRYVLQLAPRSKLAVYARVNKEWATLALPLLYETVTLPADLSKWPFSPTEIFTSSDPPRRPPPTALAPYVRTLHVDPHAGFDFGRGESYVGCGLLYVPPLPSLRTLHLHLRGERFHHPSNRGRARCPAEVAGATAETLVLHNFSLINPLPPIDASVGEGREHLVIVFARPFIIGLDNAELDMYTAQALTFAEWLPESISRIPPAFITAPCWGWPALTLLQHTSDELASRRHPPRLIVAGVENIILNSAIGPTSVHSATEPMRNRRRLRLLCAKDWLLWDELECREILTPSELQKAWRLADPVL